MFFLLEMLGLGELIDSKRKIGHSSGVFDSK